MFSIDTTNTFNNLFDTCIVFHFKELRLKAEARSLAYFFRFVRKFYTYVIRDSRRPLPGSAGLLLEDDCQMNGKKGNERCD